VRFHTQQDEEALFTARALDRSTLTSCIIGSKRQHLQQPFQQEQHLLHQQWTVPLTEGATCTI